MRNKLAKLVDVKSIMTLLLTVVFCILAFHFGTQATKNQKTDAE